MAGGEDASEYAASAWMLNSCLWNQIVEQEMMYCTTQCTRKRVIDCCITDCMFGHER